MKPERHSSGRELTHALTLSAHCQWTCQENVISQNLRSPVTCAIPPAEPASIVANRPP